MNRDIALSRKLGEELSPAELTGPHASKFSTQHQSANIQRTHSTEQLLIMVVVILYLAAVTFMVVFLANWSDRFLQACVGISLYELLGFTVGSVLHIIQWLVWLFGSLAQDLLLSDSCYVLSCFLVQ